MPVNNSETGHILQAFGKGKRAENFSLTTPSSLFGIVLSPPVVGVVSPGRPGDDLRCLAEPGLSASLPRTATKVEVLNFVGNEIGKSPGHKFCLESLIHAGTELGRLNNDELDVLHQLSLSHPEKSIARTLGVSLQRVGHCLNVIRKKIRRSAEEPLLSGPITYLLQGEGPRRHKYWAMQNEICRVPA